MTTNLLQSKLSWLMLLAMVVLICTTATYGSILLSEVFETSVGISSAFACQAQGGGGC